MAYHIDSYDNALVIDGFEKGIAPNPYQGISDARNVLINTIPGEAAVGFSTGSLSAVISIGTITSVSGNTVTFSGGGGGITGIESGMSLSLGTVSNYTGLSAGTMVYFIVSVTTGGSGGGGTMNLYTDFNQSSQVTITGSGNAGFTVYNPDFSNYQGNTPNRFARSTRTGNMYLQDSKGIVWTNQSLTTNGFWRHIGNARHTGSFIGDNSNGNGIVYYQSLHSSSTGYLFFFSDTSIDYVKDNFPTSSIVYGWNPTDGSANNNLQVLNATANSGASHDSLVGQDNVVYYCDANYIGSIFEKVGQTINPTTPSTYTFAKNALALPAIDTAQCLAELGINLLVGGTRNLVYPWDRISTSFTYPIWLSESVIQRMLTVRTNTYIFAGNRGRIHITNGSQAQPWVKIPDHLSGTVEPYYLWGGAVSNKNQLYFSVAALTNSGVANANYGAIWAVDLETQALRIVNQMSYGSYAGLAPALFAITPLYNGGALVGNPNGAGLYIGWCSGNVQNSGQSIAFSGGNSGIDQTTANANTNSISYIDSDLIPIGTFTKPRTFQRIEYLLTKPLVSGESITLQYRTDFSQNYTTIATDSTTGNYANTFPTNWTYSQWIQIRAILNSTLTNPSYVRLKLIRITGLVGPTVSASQQVSI